MKNCVLFFAILAVCVGLYSCKSELSSEQKSAATEKSQTPKMSDEKAMGKKGNRTGRLPAKTFRIKDHTVNGIKAGMLISELQHVLVWSKIKNGEGTFEVYRIRDDKSAPMGYVVPRIGNNDLVGDITLHSKKVLSEHGIRIGDEFSKLQEAVKDIKVNGSKIEGRVYASIGRIYYRLDIVDFNYNLDLSQIPLDTKITEILIKDLR